MIRKASFLVIGTFVLLGAGSARAQGTDPLIVGNRVRVTLASQHRVEGHVLAADEQTLTLLAGDQPVKVPRADITTAEMSVGRRSAWLKGAAIGTSAGLLLGLVLPLDTDCSSNPGDPRYRSSCLDSRGALVGVGALGGALWGVGIGALIKHDVWAPMHLDRVHVGLAPRRRGGAMQVSVVF